MNKVDVEKLFQGKAISQDQNQVHIQLQDSRKRLELSIENDVLTLIEQHRDYALNILKNLKRKTNRKVTRESITINHRNYKIFI
ncbi:hypothetical protein ACPBEH_00615 [Latilactobacillus sp. 5-91]|uniref:hypothetical protein n=1 Tax=Latilactobacillus sp. 5-91 TaxID=3410924 RepID=UPI003C789AC0